MMATTFDARMAAAVDRLFAKLGRPAVLRVSSVSSYNARTRERVSSVPQDIDITCTPPSRITKTWDTTTVQQGDLECYVKGATEVVVGSVIVLDGVEWKTAQVQDLPSGLQIAAKAVLVRR